MSDRETQRETQRWKEFQYKINYVVFQNISLKKRSLLQMTVITVHQYSI